MSAWGRFRRKRRRPRSTPEPKAGIAARSRRGALGETWWSARFIDVLESFAIGSRLQRGRSYARGGRVLDLQVESGVVGAHVQGSRRQPYAVEIRVKRLPAAAWTRLEKALAGQALFAARLLAGEMPREIEEVFTALDLSLFPAAARELETSCSCPDFANPCKHIAATFYILAEAFDEDPFLIFAWRGRARATLIANLRALRGATADAAPVEDGESAEAAPLLAVSGDDFWRAHPAFSGLHVAPHASDSPDALLRQLGPPPADTGGVELLERLASAYRAMASGAERLAFADRAAQDAPADMEKPAPPTPGKSRRRSDSSDAPDTPRAARRRKPRFYVTDLQDFDPEVGRSLPPAARRLWEFFCVVVRTGTSLPVDEPVLTPLRCLRAGGRRGCAGHVLVELVEQRAEITWRCDACDEAGVLHGWECSMHDLGGRAPDPSAMRERRLLEPDYALLAGLDLADVRAEQVVRGAYYQPGVIRLAGTSDEFDALLAELDFAIDATTNRNERSALRRVHDALA